MSKQLMSAGIKSLAKGVTSGFVSKRSRRKHGKPTLGDSLISGNDENHSFLTMPRSITTMFPDLLRITLKDDFVINWTGTAGATNGFQSLANGLHLPISSGPISGANPIAVGTANSIYGLGNLLTNTGAAYASTGPYIYYRILCTKIIAVTNNTSSLPSDAAELIILPVSANFGFGNVNTWNANTFGEMPYSKRSFISGTTINQGVRMEHCITTQKIAGVRYRSTMDGTEYQAQQGTNPSFLWSWVFGWFPVTAGTTSATTAVRVLYEIEFFNRTSLPSTNG